MNSLILHVAEYPLWCKGVESQDCPPLNGGQRRNGSTTILEPLQATLYQPTEVNDNVARFARHLLPCSESQIARTAIIIQESNLYLLSWRHVAYESRRRIGTHIKM